MLPSGEKFLSSPSDNKRGEIFTSLPSLIEAYKTGFSLPIIT
jgi:hypothetical protein